MDAVERNGLADGSVSRRTFLGATGAALAAAACAPTATPAQPPTTVAPGTAKAAWEGEWDEMVAAAKREGQINLVLAPGYGNWGGEAFQAAFPDIKVQWSQFANPAADMKKLLDERTAGVYERDAGTYNVVTMLQQGRPAGVLAPVRPVLIKRPDVVDDSLWYGGLESGWIDKNKELSIAFSMFVNGLVAIDTNQIGENEIKTIDDLLNPKWKGKMVWRGPTGPTPNGSLTNLRLSRGEETVKRLIVDQQATFFTEGRLSSEAVLKGNKPIGIAAPNPGDLKVYLREGVGRNIKFIDIPELTYVITSGVWLYDRAPHPNAAKLFVNWSMTKQAGERLVAIAGFNSRRTDVTQAEPLTVTKPGRKYVYPDQEEMLPEIQKTIDLLAELVKQL